MPSNRPGPGARPRGLALVAFVLTAAPLPLLPAAPQSPLVTTFADDNGGAPGGSVYFDLEVLPANGVTLTHLDLNTSSTAGTIDVWIVDGGYSANAGTPTAWTFAGSGQLVGAGAGNPTAVCLAPAVQLAAGTWGIALHGPGVAHRYTNGGPGVPLTYATGELTLTAGAASNLPFGGVQYEPRIWNGRLHYAVGTSAGLGCAGSESLGAGCVDGAVSFYEDVASLSAFDLAGSMAAPGGLVATAAGDVGYVVLAANEPWHVPAGVQVRKQGASTALGDDDISEPLALPFSFPFAGGSTNVVHVAADGYVVLGSTSATSSDLLPTPAKLLAQAPRLVPLWCDLHPTANTTSNPLAGVWFDVMPGNHEVVITWLDVADGRAGTPLPGTTTINVQCVLRSNGDFVFRYGDLTPGSGIGRVLTGWSPGAVAGGPARDPGSADLSASLPHTTTGPDSFPLAHTAGLARLGLTLDLHVADAENVLPFAVLVAGRAVALPGIDLTALGAPGCRAFTTIDATATVPLTSPGGTGSLALAVPNLSSLLATSFASQFAALSTRNALGLATSNAMVWTIGH